MKLKKRRSLGEGLEVILTAAQMSVDEAVLDITDVRELRVLNISQLISGRYQPRREFDSILLQELADSIKEQGLIQPIIARRMGEFYEIVAGERRWRAAQIAGLVEIPVIICEISDESALAFGVIENIQRQDLNPIEEAFALKRLLTEFSMTHEQIAKTIGRSRTMVTNMLRILNLADPVKELLAQSQLDLGHAKVLLGLDKETQILVANKIVTQLLSVRAAETIAQKIKTTQSYNKSSENIVNNVLDSQSDFSKKIETWKNSLSARLIPKVNIQIDSKGKGRVVINFDSIEDADWIFNHFQRRN